MVLFLGVVDFGDAFARRSSATAASRGAAMRAFDASSSADHDRRVLETLVLELSNQGIEQLELVVVYRPTTPSGPPPACVSPIAVAGGGVAGLCNTYGPEVLDEVIAGTAGDLFDQGCDTGPDGQWCPADRVDPAGWTVGIWFRAEREALIGMLPFFRSFPLEEDVRVQEFDR